MVNLNKDTTVGLIKSDPGLTGNIKIVIDSNNKVYLNSVHSNSFISKNIYNKFIIDEEFSLNYSLNRYLTQEPISDLNHLYTTNDISLFEKKCILNNDSDYSERFSFFAPIYIHPSFGIPNYFIIFRKDNINLSKCSIAKTFDLKKYSFGNIFNNNYISNLPKKIWYKEAGSKNYYYFYGINYKYSIFGKSFKLLSDDWDISVFKDINLLSGNHFNLNFLFNDGNNKDNNLYFGKYLFVDKNFGQDVLLNIDKQNLYFDHFINKYDYSNLDSEKYKDCNTIYTLNDIQIDFDNSFCVINDRNNNVYKISNFTNNTLILNDNLNFSDIYGTRKDYFNRSGATRLNKGSKNIKIDLYKNYSSNIFNTGDFIEIDCEAFDNFKYRIIASEKSCCDKNDICINKETSYLFQSDNINITNYTDFNLIKVKCFNYFNVPVEVGNNIKVSCNLFTNKILNIDNISYNYNEEYFELSFLDKDGIFNDLENIGILIFEYKTKKYNYTFFNPRGASTVISKRIVESFNKFNSKLFDFSYINNSIIIKLKQDLENFGKINLIINTSKSSTNLSNFVVNNINLNGKKYYDEDNNIILNKKVSICNFSGESNNFGSRASVNKFWINDYLDGDEIITCNSGLRKIKKHIIDNNIQNFKTNYIDEPVYYNKNINNYTNIDNFYVLSVENDIFLLNDNYLYFYKEFIPKIYKLLFVEEENI